MSNYFDDLIKEGRDTDAMRLFAREYYEKGKMGHTRLRLSIRIADENDKLNTDNAALRARIAELEAELAVTGRALGLACDHAATADVSCSVCPLKSGCDPYKDCETLLKDYYLQQARAELAGEAYVQRD